MVRRTKPRIVKHKPYLNLDMASHQAPRMARMALRVFRAFPTIDSDPWTIESDEDAVRQLEEFIKDPACPAWLFNRYEQHNRVATRKRKASERKEECADKQALPTTEAHEDEADDDSEQSGIRRRTEADAPQLNNAGIHAQPLSPLPFRFPLTPFAVLAWDLACLLDVGLAC